VNWLGSVAILGVILVSVENNVRSECAVDVVCWLKIGGVNRIDGK